MNYDKIEILIGADNLEAHEVYDIRHGKRGQPKGIKTGLGWAIFGPDGTGSSSHYINFTTMILICQTITELTSARHLKISGLSILCNELVN